MAGWQTVAKVAPLPEEKETAAERLAGIAEGWALPEKLPELTEKEKHKKQTGLDLDYSSMHDSMALDQSDFAKEARSRGVFHGTEVPEEKTGQKTGREADEEKRQEKGWEEKVSRNESCRSRRTQNHEDWSIWARIAYNPKFENSTMAVITFNAIWIGVDTEWNHASLTQNGKLPLEPVSIAIENFFCVYFTGELFIRFAAYKEKKMCFLDSWFVFDSILVGCMILETWIMVIVEAIMAAMGSGEGAGGGVGPLSALRLLRLLRLARVGRLMHFLPELGKLVHGMVKAARSVIFILIFLVLVIYVFAIIFTSSLSDRTTYPLTPYCWRERAHGLNETEDCLGDDDFGELAQDLFATMGDSFMSLFTRGVLGDNLDETVAAILDASLLLMWMFIIFLIITFATLLNMLIGVVCEVISDSAKEEEEAETVNDLTTTIEDAFAEIDENGDGLVCHEEWSRIKDNKAVRKSFHNIGIEDERMEERLRQMEEMIFNDSHDEDDVFKPKEGERDPGEGLSVEELIQRVVDIRPDQNASALDLELFKGQVTKDQKIFKSKLKKIEEGVKQILGPGCAIIEDDMPDMPGMPGLPGDNETDGGSNEENMNELVNIVLADVPTAMLIELMSDRKEKFDAGY